ncbi:MAG: PilZ domain-containing protein [Deltaproteobacteria bacterium]|nr:PilZ domain-containing protein [Deltaproteobacteria bacterium]
MKADEITRLRVVLGRTQEALARELGVSFSTVNRWENGKSSPSPMAKRVLDALASAHGLSSVPLTEKRGAPRVEMRCPFNMRRMSGGPGRLSSGSGEGAVMAVTDDLSLGGLRFKTALDIRPGDRLEIGLGPEGASLLGAPGTVVWTHGNDGERNVGVRFAGIRPEDLTRAVSGLLTN